MSERKQFNPEGKLETQRTTFEYDISDAVLDRYKKRSEKAKNEINTEPVPLESSEGQEMMAMINEYTDMAEGLRGTDIPYAVDGGIGLSLRQLGESQSFLRQHRDFDVITPEEELNKFNQAINSREPGQRWGIFEIDEAAVTEKGKLVLSPLSLEPSHGWKRLAALPVLENGQPDNQRYGGLTAVDIHYPKRNKAGKMIYNNRLVEEGDLFGQEQVELPNGSKTPVVGLKQMAINKALADRPQDKIDLDFILSKMSSEEKAAFEKNPSRHKERKQFNPDSQPAKPGLTSENEVARILENSKELIGSENYFGPEDIEKTFGIHLESHDIPAIQYTDAELEQAKENDEQLILRIGTLPDGQPVTLERLNNYLKNRGKRVIDESDEELGHAKRLDMEYYTQETQAARWVLTQAKKIEGTERLSYDAQQAFMRSDFEALQKALQRIPQAWVNERLPQDTFSTSSMVTLPTVDDLKTIREKISLDTSLPTAVEAVYDLLLRKSRGENVLPNTVFATGSQIQELPEIETPWRRPVDVGPMDAQNGIPIHNRRSLNWGRPIALGDNEPGIPIAYTQR